MNTTPPLQVIGNVGFIPAGTKQSDSDFILDRLNATKEAARRCEPDVEVIVHAMTDRTALHAQGIERTDPAPTLVRENVIRDEHAFRASGRD